MWIKSRLQRLRPRFEACIENEQRDENRNECRHPTESSYGGLIDAKKGLTNRLKNEISAEASRRPECGEK